MPPALAPGLIIAQRYRLTQFLGEGGMGVVWSATHTVTRRQVAIKMPRREVRADVRRRFLREAMAMAAVDHPNVVRVHDAFELEDGTPIMVMDLLRGETFGSLLEREQSLPLLDALRILLPVISAAGTAHAYSIVHRDLKPDNVFLANVEGNTVVKVLDFGIAKLDGGIEQATITTTGSAMGTPCYMAPEQSLGEKDIDQRADVWAIGVMLYEALAGGRPVEGDSLGQIVKKLLTEAITPIGSVVPSLPPQVQSLIDRMLARNRADRLDDLREALTTLSMYGDVRVPSFDAPRSHAIPGEAEGQSEVRQAPHLVGPVTTNAPETLRSAPPEGMTNRDARRRVGAAIVAAGVVATALMVGWPGTSARRDPVLGAAGAASVGNAPTSSNAPNPETIVSVELSKEPVPTERAAPAMPSSSVAVPVPLAPKSKRRPGAMTSASATTAVAAPVTASSPRPADPPANKSPAKRGLAEEVPF